MFKFNNTHIFTGYLKQKLSSVYIPACKIYTKEYANYLDTKGKEDPRVIKSVDTIAYSSEDVRLASRVNYLKGSDIYNFFWDYTKNDDIRKAKTSWKRSSSIYYQDDKFIPGLTRHLVSPGRFYDKTTHEYLGDYLRFLRDYYDVNLMSMYNCFNDEICNNVHFKCNLTLNKKYNRSIVDSKENSVLKESDVTRVFDSQDTRYKIYAIPVKLFENYTIAIDSYQGVEMFCGFYKSEVEASDKADYLFAKTYRKEPRTAFNQPILYDALDVKNWLLEDEFHTVQYNSDGATRLQLNNNIMSRWDIANREQDLRLFIKIPALCESSITILEGDYRAYNDVKLELVKNTGTAADGNWAYRNNHTALNFENSVKADLNNSGFKPISKLQLLAFNTRESYPFADRLVEYLCDSAITPLDEIHDNIKRAQRVMRQNGHYFKIEGFWENKMQKIIYDYLVNSGPVELKDGKMVDKHHGHNPWYHGYHPRQGHTTKSTLYDILGYVDKDAEKWYASWKQHDSNNITTKDTIQSIDIYDGLFDV